MTTPNRNVSFRERLLNNKTLKSLGEGIMHPVLWNWDREPCARAVAVGLFVCWIPTPGQMLIAATMALKMRANLPISTSLVWVSNPITWAPLYYFAYWIGCKMMSIVPAGMLAVIGDGPSFANFSEVGYSVLLPLFLGVLVSSTVMSIAGYFVARSCMQVYEYITESQSDF